MTSVDLCSSHINKIYKQDLKHLIQYVIISAVWNLEDSETEKEMDALRKAEKEMNALRKAEEKTKQKEGQEILKALKNNKLNRRKEEKLKKKLNRRKDRKY